ncbi:MAG: Uma2 family endonuclease [Calditrichae bacterium]|nr:Uma2 family endonuclease [Calditrichia bacterium]NIV71988.1 Uma2 family endonuclease [Calditrichia bacterium]NIW79066.1 Uma2 family endonuclease [Calditrichia bacterium]
MSTQTLENKKWTYDDYIRIDNQNRYEVIEGELVMAPSPLTQHQRVSGKLESLLGNFVEKKKLGEVFDAPFDVIISPHNVFPPDILFLSNENLGILTGKNVQGAPDLIVEILSPGTAVYDMGVNKEVYERAGVKELWVFDPESETGLAY